MDRAGAARGDPTPVFRPVRFKRSLSAQRSGMSGSASTACVVRLIVRFTMRQAPCSAPPRCSPLQTEWAVSWRIPELCLWPSQSRDRSGSQAALSSRCSINCLPSSPSRWSSWFLPAKPLEPVGSSGPRNGPAPRPTRQRPTETSQKADQHLRLATFASRMMCPVASTTQTLLSSRTCGPRHHNP